MRSRTALMLALTALMASGSAVAFTVDIWRLERMLYLRVGAGSAPFVLFGYPFVSADPAKTTVAATLPASAVPVGGIHPLTPVDQPGSCAAPGVVVSAIYAAPGNRTATLSAEAPMSLDNATAGASIPFSRIGWASTDTAVIGNGSFSGGVQTLGSYRANTYNETCLTFSYNKPAGALAAGEYRGTVTYTLYEP